ncbi:MAG: hypothetical protein DI629_03575 [Mesorhizobium amorphae]|nr:MAG: hypothetical protein DI629_03575 [Mesorhizobium amorphae]
MKRLRGYTEAETAFLLSSVGLVEGDLQAEFARRFGRVLKSNTLACARRALGVRTGRNQRYTAEEKAFIAAPSTMTDRELAAAFTEKFGRRVTQHSISGCRRSNQFRVGEFVHRPSARAIEASAVGGDYIDKAGYVIIRLPRVRTAKGKMPRSAFLHRILWEERFGPVPAGSCLKAIGGRSNPDPANWELVPLGVVPRLHKRGFDQAPATLKPVILATAKLEHVVAKAIASEATS